MYHNHTIVTSTSVIIIWPVFFLHPDCADQIPKFKAEQIGDFSTELLQKLVSKSETKEDHLKFLLFEMPPVFSKPPFNASTIELVKILKMPVTDIGLLKSLFELGMSIKPNDILVAVQTLSESHLNLLDLILSSCKCTKAEMNVNALCKVAMEAGKMEFVAFFIKYWGVAPPPEELKQRSGWPEEEVHPVINRYLTFANNPASRVAGVPNPVMKGTALDPSLVDYDEVTAILYYLLRQSVHTRKHAYMLKVLFVGSLGEPGNETTFTIFIYLTFLMR